ncbi:beta strand repeat-containing protein [Hymenobacter psoromatis]|uniref:beta strand repeat-containing protein n=1 Tax=Hymenobacter psoromatis TaxID=1484116 RepID=UPI001CC02DBF
MDHTSGFGNMLMVNAASPASATAICWQQTVTGLQANQSYTFSFWLLNNFYVSPASIQVSASGSSASTGGNFADVGAPFSNTSGTTTGSTSVWQQFSLTLTTGSASTQLTIRLRDLVGASNGDDFSLDDLALIVQPGTGIRGTVFEDTNYGGGAGRPYATAASSAAASGQTAAVGRPGATVELYTSTSVLAGTTTTDASGQYSFPTAAAGSYTVRVVNGTVTSARAGAVAGLLPVQTFRTTNGSADGNRVGGEYPGGTDGSPNSNINLTFTGQNNNGDNTAFVDNVEVLQGGAPLSTNPIANPGFENGTITGGFQYTPTGAGIGWTFNAGSGIQSNNSAFTPPNTSSGVRAALLQNVASMSQGFNLPAGTYTVRFQAAKRSSGGVQTLSVTVNGTNVLANLQTTNASYATYQTAAFTVGSGLSSIGAQSIAPITVSSTGITGVDFGFNFDLIVNANDAGQGSLRQFITNANALGGEATLAQSGNYVNQVVGANPIKVSLPAGVETSIFMVSDGKVHPGLLANNGSATGGPASLLSGGTSTTQVAAISASSALPTITGPATAVNGWTQTANIGNTNDVTLGTGGSVGTAGTILPQLNGPEVQLAGTGAINVGLNLTATGDRVLGLAIYGFGTAGDSDNDANIRSAANQVSLQGNVVGSAASSFALPPTVSNADGIRAVTGTGLSLTNNLIGFNIGKGVTTNSAVTGAILTANEFRSNAAGSSAWAGLSLRGSTSTISSNLFSNNAGAGIDAFPSAGGNIWSGNTVAANGKGTSASAPNTTPGIRIYGVGDQVTQNLIYDNYGAGILVDQAATKVVISQNSIYNNGALPAANGQAASGQLGIDLEQNGDNNTAGTGPYVTLNSTATTGANSLINYPILQSARLNGTTLVVAGLAAVGVTVELFIASPNNVANPNAGNNFGQGNSYLGGQVIASSGGTGSYGPPIINGFPQGSGTNVNSFTISIPLAGLTAAQRSALSASGALLTSTATLTSTGTSEFSGNAPVVSGPTAFNVTNVNVAANSAAAALNPGLTVPQAASDPNNSIVSFTVFPATGGTLLYNGAAIPAGGQLIPIANTNKLTFQPTNGSTVSGVFSFYATNAAGGTAGTSNTATYTIPVTNSNNAYVANDDGLDVPKNTATNGNVLLNDTQPANATTNFTVTQVGTGPSHGTVTLNADGSYTYTPSTNYLGSDSFQYQVCQSGVCSNTATVTINVYDPALVCNIATGPDLLQNPGFEQGNTVFTSAYNYVSPAANSSAGNGGLIPETTYAVDVNANTYHPSFAGKGRGGSGNFMIVNGAANQSKVYAQTVTVVANRYYSYSGYAQSVNPQSPAILGFVINNKSTSASATLPTTTGTYVQFSGVWYSGSSTSATFEVRDINRAAGGNDFGLDDLYFGTCSVNLMAANITNSPGIPALAPATSIAPLNATVTGTGAAVASFTIQTLPTSGTLRVGGPNGQVVTAGQVIPYNQRGALYYTAANGFAGNATFTYTATDTENAGSGNIATYTIPVSSVPLPVVLATFTAKAAGTTAQLAWTTASEVGNAYFAIERSSTGQAANFVAIDKVAGYGTTTTAHAYAFIDRNAAAIGALVYYRLHQVDADGTSSYSPVRAVSFAPAGSQRLTLYPNPTVGARTSLDLSSLPATAIYQVRLLDATGRSTRQWTLAGGQSQPLDVADLATGTYLVLVSGSYADGSVLRQVLHLTKE